MKFFKVLLVALFVVCFAIPAFAGDSPVLGNYEILGASGGATGVSAPTEVVRVRLGRMPASYVDASSDIVSGDVLVWDTTSADGITVSKCIVSSPTDSGYFAGVAVTGIQTADSAKVSGNERNWGYMAVRGFCYARVDTGRAATGQKLVLTGATETGSFGTATSAINGYPVSEDIGVLLTDTATSGMMKVLLK